LAQRCWTVHRISLTLFNMRLRHQPDIPQNTGTIRGLRHVLVCPSMIGLAGST
jgi:hypothetical protein